jgi:hypothetical protein
MSSIFPIDINNKISVGHIRETIIEKISVPTNTKAKDITLWKINLPYDENIERVNIELKNNEKTGIKKLCPLEKINDVFINIPDNHIHIIIELPDTGELKLFNTNE